MKGFKHQTKVLPIIVFSQFACTSLWFAVNAVMPGLAANFNIDANDLVHIVSAVQFGFITGTLSFAFFNITDRFSPSKVFIINAMLGGASNLLIMLPQHTFSSIMVLRFLTGFFLAGIYPVGMKIAADYFEKGLGKALGFLVGALVLGTAFPHFIAAVNYQFGWKVILLVTSILTVVGGVLIWVLVPDGPFRKKSSGFDIKAFTKIFNNKKLVSAAVGYFGHMWELYTFWAFVPLMLSLYMQLHSGEVLNISLWSFIAIAVGCLSCIAGGYISLKAGSKKTAAAALFLSLLCCIFSVLFFNAPPAVFLIFIIFWGIVVIADSPQFSTLVAQASTDELRGTSLTIVNSIGFAITIVSLQVMNYLLDILSPVYAFTILAIGPIIGLIGLLRKR